MPRGRHRSVSTATRISLLAAICAPALVAVVLAVVAGGATTLRIAVLLGVSSAAGALAWVVRGSTAHHRRSAEEAIARRRERERMADELRAAIERVGEHELALDRAGASAAAHLVSRPQPLTPDLLARGAAVLDLLDRRAGEARPTAPSIVPAVRRPPVSSPDLVPAYAASVFGPSARPRPAAPTHPPRAPQAPQAPVHEPVRAEEGRTPEVRPSPTRAAEAPREAAPTVREPVPTVRPVAPIETAPGAAAPEPIPVRPSAPLAPETAPAAVTRPASPIAPPTELTRTAERTLEAPAESEVAAEAPATEDAPTRSASSPVAAAPASAEAPAPAEASGPAVEVPEASPVAAAPAPAEAAESADSETAEVTRMVRDKVLEVTRRVADSGASGRFDFFAPRASLAEPEATGFLTDELFGSDARYDALVAGRPHEDEVEAAEATFAPDPVEDDIEADRLADPVRAEEAPATQPAPVHRGHGVRFAPDESDPSRPGVPRPKPLPVDLTAHDDTEEIPRIDIRKHA
ncbi:hypothetical protein OG948_16775 [Embleya sp. NBC_00888]|uniref:hypothetical protein n=1 Tax=Embleya sp. NBC_00888 TaxID=2975960 RepID=UPI00386C9CAD|nr:hypothetical protein OG948_16775 [Embleya sp. NBC_00888]